MEKSFAAVAPVPSKKAARVALVDLKESSRFLLAECFRQFGIDTVVTSTGSAERLRQEKFEACVIPLRAGAESVMEAARNSPSNSRLVLYGLGGSAQDAMRFSKFGVNAMFQEPLERPAALKLVRSTHMLVLHEFRRYARVPIMTEVTVSRSDGQRITASSVEISSGGMSVKSAEDIPAGSSVEVSFALLTLPRVNVRGVVSWRKNKSFGVHFDSGDDRRRKIKEWIDGFLES
ncbi:MAG TPA: PilZ domain-containing protein [Candidatus Binatia bacterium]|nr:PilZ domain-containing protein [Candidatus Binatia bacterium]